MFKRFLFIAFLLLVVPLTLAQEDNYGFKPLDLRFGFGIGNKSHLGNFGATANLHFTKNISLKTSYGLAPANYGGGVVSPGLEYSFLFSGWNLVLYWKRLRYSR